MLAPARLGFSRVRATSTPAARSRSLGPGPDSESDRPNVYRCSERQAAYQAVRGSRPDTRRRSHRGEPEQQDGEHRRPRPPARAQALTGQPPGRTGAENPPSGHVIGGPFLKGGRRMRAHRNQRRLQSDRRPDFVPDGLAASIFRRTRSSAFSAAFTPEPLRLRLRAMQQPPSVPPPPDQPPREATP